MQQSFIISFPFEEKSLKEPMEDFLVLPKNTIGAYILMKGDMRRITINIPRISYKRSLIVVYENSKKVSADIAFFNFVCSLQKCAIYFNILEGDNPDIKELNIKVTTCGEDAKFIKSTREILSRNIC